jgi:hypothetical protein
VLEDKEKQYDERELLRRHINPGLRRRRVPNMSKELTVPLVAGLFGLVTLMVQIAVQIATTRVQRRDRMFRLNQLKAELELLERLHTLQGEVSATDEAAKPQTDPVIRDSLSKVLEQYNKLSEFPPSAVRVSLRGPIALVAAIIIAGSGIQISREIGCIGLGLWIISELAPLPLGLWISLHWPGQHRGAYLGIGLLLGVIGFIASGILVSLFYPPGVYKASDWAILILTYPIWCTAMTVAGGLYGDSVKSRRDPSETTNLVRKFAGGVGVCGAIFGILCQVAG